MGKIAAADRQHFGPLEEAMEEGMLSYARSVERGKDYGMWNYADTHTIWHVGRIGPTCIESGRIRTITRSAHPG